jgi:hypothetical protein
MIEISQPVQQFLNTTCFRCHGEGEQEGEVQLDTLPPALDAPKCPATREGWTFRREFEHASVFVDGEMKTAKID